MSHEWEPMDSAPSDRPIIVAGGTYHYKAGRKPSIYDAGPSLRQVKWDGIGWKHTTIATRYDSPVWWIDPLPPVPQGEYLSLTASTPPTSPTPTPTSSPPPTSTTKDR